MNTSSRAPRTRHRRAQRPVLLGETYLDADAGRMVRVIDRVRPAGNDLSTVLVEAADSRMAERWPCSPAALIPVSAGGGAVALLAIARRLVDRGAHLLGSMDLSRAAGVFASASLALEILAGELRLRSAANAERATTSTGQETP